MALSARPRLLIFVIAYRAEATLKQVLERIPITLFSDFDCEILVVDDASNDRTFGIGTGFKEAHSHTRNMRMTVLRNEYNQGYGGNQKVGYSYAIAEKFDFVAMVHGDGQYAPEELPKLVEPLRRGEADAVFGSRMLERFGALQGGMPLYKYVGNKILTTIQNRLLGTNLSEFHSGYRVYSVAMLARLPFRLNSNDFHFDTEIIIQLLNAKAKITELPIPTYYGDEICHVNGLKYAKDVVVCTVQNVAHRSGIFYQRRFDLDLGDNSHYDVKHGYASRHTYALAAIPSASRVLDIGAGPGAFANELLKKQCQVTLVDQHNPETSHGRVGIVVQDLDDDIAFDVAHHDVLLMLDIIEHLKDPERFIERLRLQFDHSTKKLVLTMPNAAFIVQRLMLLLGQFNYGKAGILDRTHTRMFTFRTIRRLLQDEGFRIVKVTGVPAPFPKVLGNGFLGRAALGANLALIRLSKTLFSYQIYLEAESTPSVSFVLEDSKSRSVAHSKPRGETSRSDDSA